MPVEMKAVAAFFGKEVLHDVDEAAFYRHIAEVRKVTGDRAVLRAIHFFNENRRVKSQVRALKDGDFDAFLHLVNASGMASWTLLQNVTPAGYIQKQDMAFTICASSCWRARVLSVSTAAALPVRRWRLSPMTGLRASRPASSMFWERATAIS